MMENTLPQGLMLNIILLAFSNMCSVPSILSSIISELAAIQLHVTKKTKLNQAYFDNNQVISIKFRK